MALDRARGAYLERSFSGRSFRCAVFTPASLDHLREIRSEFLAGLPVEARLNDVPDADLKAVVDYLDALAGASGGEMWEVEDSVVLLMPQGGPPADTPDDGDDPSGDREPRRPVAPAALHTAALDLPDADAGGETQ